MANTVYRNGYRCITVNNVKQQLIPPDATGYQPTWILVYDEGPHKGQPVAVDYSGRTRRSTRTYHRTPDGRFAPTPTN